MANALPTGKKMIIDIFNKSLLWAMAGLTTIFLAYSIPGASGDPLQPVPDSVPIAQITTITPTPTTTIPPGKSACNEYLSLALVNGFAISQADTITVILMRESHCKSGAYNPSDPNGGSYGLYQINGFWCTPNKYWLNGWLQAKNVLQTCNDLFNPIVSTRAAYQIWLNSGFTPWNTQRVLSVP